MKPLLSLLIVFGIFVSFAAAEDLRLNQIQVIGTHNSYHIEPHPSIMKLIGTFSKNQASAIAYTHRPLETQFAKLGIRQIELDVWADPKGGMYAKPRGPKMAADANLPAVPHHDPEGELLKPGLKIIHSPDVDYFTTVKTFVGALRQVKSWSEKNPRHIPIMIMVEVKQGRPVPGFTKSAPFDAEAFDTIDREILSVFEPAQIISPDSVRGDKPTLREAISQDGWPTLKDSRGKVIFALDNGGDLRDAYLKDHPSLRGRLLFVSVDESHPAAAFMKLNDAVGQFDHIQQMVRQGFLVRTRADSPTTDARTNNTAKRDKALASGAQFVSTDYPEANLEFSEYRVQLPGGAVFREPGKWWFPQRLMDSGVVSSCGKVADHSVIVARAALFRCDNARVGSSMYVSFAERTTTINRRKQGLGTNAAKRLQCDGPGCCAAFEPVRVFDSW